MAVMHSLMLMCAMLAEPAAATKPAKGNPSRMLPGQISRLMTIGLDGSDPRVILETPTLIEAPNWTPDGKHLIYNGDGTLWRIAADGSGGGKPERIDTGNVGRVNNDHVLSDDGKIAYVSADGHIYAIPLAGGPPRKITNDKPGKFRHYLHGISPDGQTLSYVGVADKSGDLYTIPAAGGADTQLTHTPEHEDGAEYSPDGKWIYYNSDKSDRAQVWRMTADGKNAQQLTNDERVNWFPHVSPDGQWVVYLSYPTGATGHPGNLDVILRRMRPDGSEQKDVTAFFGGQGTINVRSWSPDSKRFAFVAYPIVKKSEPAK